MIADFVSYVNDYSQEPWLYSLANEQGCERLEKFLRKHLDKEILKSKSYHECFEILGLSEWFNFRNLIDLKLPWEDAFSEWIRELHGWDIWTVGEN